MKKRARREAAVTLGDFRDGRDENNLAEFPLALLGDTIPEGLKTLEFEDTITDWKTGNVITRRVCITGSDKFGLPTAKDEDVLLGLVQLTKIANEFTTPEVWFTKHQIIELLGWKNRGWAYDRVEEALHRWKGVSIHYWNAWRDNVKGTWRNSEAIGVIEYFSLTDARQRTRSDGHEGLSRFIWNKVLFESFQAGYLKKLDFGLYRRLERPAAKRAYRFLDKRFYHSPEWEFELRQFACEKLGFSHAYDTGQLKQRLAPALKELVEIGYIEPVRYRKQRPKVWKIAIERKRAAEESAATEREPLADWETDLIGRGVAPESARELGAKFPPEKIREKIALFDWLVKNNDKRVGRNPSGFLVAAIRQDYPLPKDFLRATKEKAREPKRTRKVAPRDKKDAQDPTPAATDDRARFDHWWTALSGKEQVDFFEEALRAADGFTVATFRRLQQEGNRLAEELRLQMAFDHAKRSAPLFNKEQQP